MESGSASGRWKGMRQSVNPLHIRQRALCLPVAVGINQSGYGKVCVVFLAECQYSSGGLVQPDAEFECMGVLLEHSQDVKCVAWHPHEEVGARLVSWNVERLLRIL